MSKSKYLKKIEFDGSSLPIREFDLGWMVPNASICMIAKRGAGKSWVCREILNYYKNLPGGLVIAPTDKMNMFYGKFFPDIYIHHNYQTQTIEKLLYRQTKMIEKMRKKFEKGKKCNPRTFLVMDDCLAQKGQWTKDEKIFELFYNGRHYQIMYILTMQFPLGIKPELRGNFDYIFLMAEDFYNNQKRIYDHYAGMFPNFNSFRQVFMKLTKDYGCMVIVNRGSRKSLLDKVFWFKAKRRCIDKMGCKQFREYHKKNYDKNWKRKDDRLNVDDWVDRRKKNSIHVEKVSDIGSVNLTH